MAEGPRDMLVSIGLQKSLQSMNDLDKLTYTISHHSCCY